MGTLFVSLYEGFVQHGNGYGPTYEQGFDSSTPPQVVRNALLVRLPSQFWSVVSVRSLIEDHDDDVYIWLFFVIYKRIVVTQLQDGRVVGSKAGVMYDLQIMTHNTGSPCCYAAALSLTVCGDGWFNLCTWITQCVTGVQPHPAQSPIRLVPGEAASTSHHPHTLHNSVVVWVNLRPSYQNVICERVELFYCCPLQRFLSHIMYRTKWIHVSLPDQ